MDTDDKFEEWQHFKQILQRKQNKPPFVSERDLWWVSLGENIGREINGKGRKFSRPVIILKRLSGSFFLVAPLTSKEHLGDWYVKIRFNNRDEFVCLHQIRTIDYRRILNKMGQVSSQEFALVMEKFKKVYP